MVFPEKGTSLPLSDYKNGTVEVDYYKWYARAVGMQFPANAICIHLVEYYDLLEIGDFWDETDIEERVSVKVSGLERTEIVRGITPLDINLGIVDDITNSDSPESWLATSNGPYEWCVYAPLNEGYHEVEVTFEKTSGETLTHNWWFQLTDE